MYTLNPCKQDMDSQSLGMPISTTFTQKQNIDPKKVTAKYCIVLCSKRHCKSSLIMLPFVRVLGNIHGVLIPKIKVCLPSNLNSLYLLCLFLAVWNIAGG